MKVVKMLKKRAVRKAISVGSALSAIFFASVALAAAPGADGHMTLDALQGNISTTSNTILKIIMTVITLAGILLVIKGIVHLKQNYTGTGQEKHLSKGLASLGFGAALFIAVPITHMLVGGLAGNQAATYNNWDAAGADSGQDLTPAA